MYFLVDSAGLPLNPRTVHGKGRGYGSTPRNCSVRWASLVLIKAYLFALVLMREEDLIPNPFALIV